MVAKSSIQHIVLFKQHKAGGLEDVEGFINHHLSLIAYDYLYKGLLEAIAPDKDN